jgi:Cu(I)/Ag(I) efflux system membrane fusion protein
MRTKGWIQKLYVKSEGERVKNGQLLFALYSPDLVNAQEEYLQALRSGSRGLIRASTNRLASLGISAKQIRKLKATRKVEQLVRIYATQDGIIASLKVRQGMYVTPMMRVMSLADLSSVWVLAEVFESQVDWVSIGQPAEVKLPYRPGKTWEGRVAYIYPSLNPKTRTLRVRLRFDNPDERLKPNMYANIVIYGGAKKNVIFIPSEALIRTGRETRVILALGKGRFKARKVKAGMESGGYVQIISGLRAGEKVVTSGQFLIDSESSQKASIARMQGGDNDRGMKMPSGKGMKMPASGGKLRPVTGTGVLKKIKSNSRINMYHDPIKAIGWPSMTMDFRVVKGVSLKGLKPGDAVVFELKKGNYGYEVTAIRKKP